MSDTMSLRCWVRGDGAQQHFSVKIRYTEDVGDLKDMIKEKKKPHLDHLPANILALWKVSIPFQEAEACLPSFQPREDPSNGVVELLSKDSLIEVFPDGPPPKHIHIIVQQPGKWFARHVLLIIYSIATERLPSPIRVSAIDASDESAEGSFQTSLRRLLENYLVNDTQLPHWTTGDPEPLDSIGKHIASLKIPTILETPSLLLHNLGTKNNLELVNRLFPSNTQNTLK